MNVINEIQRINNLELEKGLVNSSASWHSKYAKSAWCFVGNLPHDLTEGDIICVMSQYGEIEDMHLVRDEETGKSQGFSFVKYEDARSCVLAVDNFTGIKILDRSIRVDHVEKYKIPKHLQEKENEKEDQKEREAKSQSSNENMNHPGHAYDGQELANEYNINQGQDLFAPPPLPSKKNVPVFEKEERKKRRKDYERKRHDHKRRRKEHRRNKRDIDEDANAVDEDDSRDRKRGYKRKDDRKRSHRQRDDEEDHHHHHHHEHHHQDRKHSRRRKESVDDYRDKRRRERKH